MRLLVCGGREYCDRRSAYAALDAVHASQPITTVIEGGAKGADTLAREWALSRSVPVITEMAKWDRLGKAAGHIRNKAMLDNHDPDLVLAFPGGRGTANMLEQADRAGVKSIRVP